MSIAIKQSKQTFFQHDGGKEEQDEGVKQRATRHLPEHVRVEIVTMLRAPVQHRVLVHDVTGERPVEYSDGERLQRREDLFRGFSNT